MRSFLNDIEIAGLRCFKADTISQPAVDKITALSKKIRRDILKMVQNANSGHIGGSLSSADIYLMLWLCANSTPQNAHRGNRDRIIISHGHTSPGLYSTLGNFGFFDMEEAVKTFRKKDSIFEGHPSSSVPGIEWGSGSLGQGLSVGCGFALAAKLQEFSSRIFVVMGDGEQQKGQLTEAAEFAAKHSLSNLTGIIDVNHLQASGSTKDIMPGDLYKKYESSGWEVLPVNGHDYNEIYQALKYRSLNNKPVMVLANTIMSRGVSFIENNYEYHGRLLTKAQYEEAEDGLNGEMFDLLPSFQQLPGSGAAEHKVIKGNPIVYTADKPIECRTAAGEAIYDLIRNNGDTLIAVVDCDLMESVKTLKVLKEFPSRFIECGIQEHNAATVSGALSKSGIIPFFLDFGVFGMDETYGQHRMNDMNGTSIKLIITHCGVDVGEDGKTHQCIDYIALTNNLPGYRLIIPADANQTDRVIRYIASTPGNFVVAMGRSKVPVLKNNNGLPFYDGQYSFSYGDAQWIREGRDAVIITAGTMVHKAVRAAELLALKNIEAGILIISCPAQMDREEIKKAALTGTVITYEDHFVSSGLGSMVASVIAENEFRCHFKKMGVVQYGKSCSAEEQYPAQGIDSEDLVNTIRQILHK